MLYFFQLVCRKSAEAECMSRKNFLDWLEREAAFALISFGYRMGGIQKRYQILYARVYLIWDLTYNITRNS